MNVERPREHQAVKGSNGKTPTKHQAFTGSNGKAAQKHCVKEKTGGRSSGGMAQKSCTKERSGPSRQLHHPSGTQRAGTIDRCITRQEESENSPSSSSDACTGLSLVSNAAAQHCKEPMADVKIHLSEEMMKQVLEAELIIKQLNELDVGEDISHEELQRYYEQLPCEPIRVTLLLNWTMSRSKSYEFTKFFAVSNITRFHPYSYLPLHATCCSTHHIHSCC